MNRQGQTIIFDCDDVLLNWQLGFRQWLEQTHGIYPSPSGPSSWNMDEWVGQPAFPFIMNFNVSESFGYLNPCQGAVEAVSRLYAAGNTLHVITACSDDPRAIQRREANLDRIFGDVFSTIVCVPLATSKNDALSALPRGIWIEDNVDHAVAGHMLGHRAFIMRRNHNTAREASSGDVHRSVNIRWIDTFDPILAESSKTSAAA